MRHKSTRAALASLCAAFFLCTLCAAAAFGADGEPEIIDTPRYILYLPANVTRFEKYPLVLAISPGADAQSMLNAWKSVADKYTWIILASKEHRNGMMFERIGQVLTTTLREVSATYPVDRTRIIAAGLSGGGMSAHYLAMAHPDLIYAVVVNTGMISENFSEGTGHRYPQNKIAVFLASPTDFRYNQMKRDREFLEGLGWTTKWIEFRGGHTIAPDDAYQQAAEWLMGQ